MKTRLGILIVFFVVLIAGCATETAKQEAASESVINTKAWYTDIVDYDFVKQYAKVPIVKGVMVIDARPKARKYDVGHIPGAVSIPERFFDKMTDKLPADKSTLLIFYCGGVKCLLSHKSAFKADKLGYTNIKVYSNGFPDWKKNGGHVGVSVEYVKKLMDKNANMIIIDSRPKKRKYDKGHIPGAISLPDSQFDQLTAQLPADKSTPLYFYCGGVKCKLSPNSASKAKKLGYTQVKLIPEGYPAWKKAFGAAAKPPAVKAGKEEGTISIASFQEIMSKAPQSLLLIDVRDSDEFKTSTIKGSINVPINDLEKKMDSFPKDKTIIFYCGTGGRAGEAYDMLQMFRPELVAYFLNAEIDFNKDGSYTLKEIE